MIERLRRGPEAVRTLRVARGLEAHDEWSVGGADSRTDPMLFGEYRAMASDGTSGRRGAFVYGRVEWRETLAGREVCISIPIVPSARLRSALGIGKADSRGSPVAYETEGHRFRSRFRLRHPPGRRCRVRPRDCCVV
jgi:hypothetical protein